MGYCCMVSLVFLNVLFAELLMFSEFCVYYAAGYLLAVYAVKEYANKKYVKAVIILILFYDKSM